MKRRRLSLLLLLAAAACEGPREPGAQSIRVLEGADPGVEWPRIGSWWLGDAIAWQQTVTFSVGDGGGVRTSVWLAQLDGSGPRSLDADVTSWWTLRQPETGSARWLVTYKQETSTATLFSPAGGGQVMLERFNGIHMGSRCEAVLGQESGPGRLWRGSDCDVMQPVTSPLVVGQMVDVQADRTLVVAPSGDAGSGIHSVDLAGATSELVPAVLGEHDEVPGMAPVGPVASSGVYGGSFRRLCIEDRCYLRYDRFLADGTRPFLMPLDTRREVAIPGQNARWVPTPPVLDSRYVVWSQDWSDPAQPSIHTRFVLWDLGSGTTRSCDVAASSFPDGDYLASAGSLVYPGGKQNPDGVTIESIGDTPCISIEKPVLSGFGLPVFSPRGTRLAFAVAGTELWLADGAGQDRRRLLAGRWFGRFEFAGSEDELIFESSTFEDPVALNLLRVGATEPVERPLVPRAFGRWHRIGRQLVVGAALDPAKRTGDLWLYDLDRHNHQLIDRDVASYTAVDQAVAYWVKGAGARDGLWVRRLP